MNFQRAVAFILRHEGGYSFDADDPGGETQYGISKRSYPYLDIKNLTKQQAVEIYETDFWEPMKMLLFPPRLRLCMFDCAVNQGRSRSIRFLQQSVGTKADGIIGPNTIKMASGHDEIDALSTMLRIRLEHYAKLPHWTRFGHGWSRRLIAVAVESLK